MRWEFQRLVSSWFTPNLQPMDGLPTQTGAAGTHQPETGRLQDWPELRFMSQKEVQLVSLSKSSKKDHYILSLWNPPPGNLPKEGKSWEHKGGHQCCLYRETDTGRFKWPVESCIVMVLSLPDSLEALKSSKPGMDKKCLEPIFSSQLQRSQSKTQKL